MAASVAVTHRAGRAGQFVRITGPVDGELDFGVSRYTEASAAPDTRKFVSRPPLRRNRARRQVGPAMDLGG